MQILAVILARAGSKGVKGKNERDFLRFPIVTYSLSAYDLFLARNEASYGDFTLALNTDSDVVERQVAGTTLPHLFIPRKPSLAGDRVSKIDVVRDTLAEAETLTGKAFDLVLDIDITSPLRRPQDIKQVIDTIIENPGADVALTVTEARRNPYFNQLVKDERGYLTTAIRSNFVARQQAPEVLDANASLYCYRPGYLKEGSGIFLAAKLVGSKMEDNGILDIDSELDFRLMEVIARYLYETDASYGEVREHIESILTTQIGGLL